MKTFLSPSIFGQNLLIALGIADKTIETAPLPVHSEHLTVPIHLLADRRASSELRLMAGGGDKWWNRAWQKWQISPPPSQPVIPKRIPKELHPMEFLIEKMMRQLRVRAPEDRRKFAEASWSDLSEDVAVALLKHLFPCLNGIYESVLTYGNGQPSKNYMHKGWEVFDFLFSKISKEGRKEVLELVLNNLYMTCFLGGKKRAVYDVYRFALATLLMARKYLGWEERGHVDNEIFRRWEEETRKFDSEHRENGIRLNKEFSTYLERLLEIESDPTLRVNLEKVLKERGPKPIRLKPKKTRASHLAAK